ncbi:helix-turn-helix domain-containing protein [Corynebacterium casei]|uniref:helix-turn-helix domain-containing protein n=1 Tax=Corynebacterium casei TaxID=160386 RepID=UPI003FD3D95E
MNRLLQVNAAIEPSRRPEPKLPPGTDPYKPISSRYLSHLDRVTIADLYREGLGVREIARKLHRSILLLAASFAAITMLKVLTVQKLHI